MKSAFEVMTIVTITGRRLPLMDARASAAKYYDLRPDFPNDVPFYVERLPSPAARVLELGCGTGRVTLPLAVHAGFIQGLDCSQAMLAICKTKIASASLPEHRIAVSFADICSYDLGQQYDLILAPFRLVQSLEADVDFRAALGCIRKHLGPKGTGILSALRPLRRHIEIFTSSTTERIMWEVPTDDGSVSCAQVDSSIDLTRMLARWTFLYRRRVDNVLVEETSLPVTLRYYHPDDFLARIRSEGFRVVGTWGGYAGEPYGEGTELVVEIVTS